MPASPVTVRAAAGHRPIRIVATMTEPIVTYGDGLYLDGPLSYGAFLFLPVTAREALPSMAGPWAEDMDLPLARWVADGLAPSTAPDLLFDGSFVREGGWAAGPLWGWCCSRARPVGTTLEATHELRKRPAVAEFQRLTDLRSYNCAEGPTKAKDLRFPTRMATAWKWDALGDPAAVRAMLRQVRGIGKLAHQGMGAVQLWTVEECADADWMDRRLPAATADEGVLAAIRAPYHHRSRLAWCIEPI